MAIILNGNTGITLPAGGTGNTAGTVVGTSDTQTLTNKTIDAGQLSGTIVKARLPAGSVLQVVYATPSTLTTSSTATGTSAPEWGSVTITPTASGNKLL